MSQTDIGTELRQAAPEPLLPVEKKLIGFSLGTGLVLLLALAAAQLLSARNVLRTGGQARLSALATAQARSMDREA